MNIVADATLLDCLYFIEHRKSTLGIRQTLFCWVVVSWFVQYQFSSGLVACLIRIFTDVFVVEVKIVEELSYYPPLGMVSEDTGLPAKGETCMDNP
jgi:hypothetical protein